MLPWAALGRRWHLLTLASKPNCPGWMMYLLGSGEQVTEPIQANKGEFVIRLLGCHRTQGQLTPGTKNVAGSPKSPCSSSFFAFPEYMLYSHSVDFLLFSYSYSTWWNVVSLFKKAAGWTLLTPIPSSLEKAFIGLIWIMCPPLAGVGVGQVVHT